jgi:cytochrome c2
MAGCGGASQEAASTPDNATTVSNTALQTDSQGKTVSAPSSTSTGAGGGETSGGGGQGDAAAGKAVFSSAGCGGCHTLMAAGSNGNVGPNLDQLKPAADVVQKQVENGGGGMPAFKGKLSDKQIADVAAFVAQNAGK